LLDSCWIPVLTPFSLPDPAATSLETPWQPLGAVHPPYRFMAIKWRTAKRGAQLVESQS
jgi:hypothetical protein